MRKQVFGYTQPESAPAGKMVKFMAWFLDEEKNEFTVEIRDDDGRTVSITMNKEQFEKEAASWQLD